MIKYLYVPLICAMLAVASVCAFAETLPSTVHTTTLTATVSEQATVTTPAGITFTVTDATAATTAASGTISCTNIVLNNLKTLKLSLQANAAAFTAPTGGSVTWNASDVSWNAGSWGTATGSANTLSSAAYGAVVQTTANAASVTGSNTFTLAAKAVDRGGNHTLVMTWKVESL